MRILTAKKLKTDPKWGNTIKELYLKNLSIREIAKEMDCSYETIRKVLIFMETKIRNYSEGTRLYNIRHPEKLKKRINDLKITLKSPIVRQKMSNAKTGKSSNSTGRNWKINKSKIKNMCGRPPPNKIKNIIEDDIISGRIFNLHFWRDFRKKILERDNYTCQICDKKANCIHHKKTRKQHPKLCFVDENVITICRACHIKIHMTKDKKIKRKDFE